MGLVSDEQYMMYGAFMVGAVAVYLALPEDRRNPEVLEVAALTGMRRYMPKRLEELERRGS